MMSNKFRTAKSQSSTSYVTVIYDWKIQNLIYVLCIIEECRPCVVYIYCIYSLTFVYKETNEFVKNYVKVPRSVDKNDFPVGKMLTAFHDDSTDLKMYIVWCWFSVSKYSIS